METLIRKVTSRKFLATVVGIITGLAMVFGLDNDTIITVSGAVTALVSIVTYVITEGKVDAESAKKALEAIKDVQNGADTNEQ